MKGFHLLVKNNTLVHINRIIDLQSEDGQSAEYRLKAIQSHTLQLNSGHYWTLVVKNQQIIECNDVTINVEPMNSVDHQKIIESAYVVFYKKTDRTEYQLASPSKLEKDKVKLSSSTNTAEDTESEKDADKQPEKVTPATETTDDAEDFQMYRPKRKPKQVALKKSWVYPQVTTSRKHRCYH